MKWMKMMKTPKAWLKRSLGQNAYEKHLPSTTWNTNTYLGGNSPYLSHQYIKEYNVGRGARKGWSFLCQWWRGGDPWSTWKRSTWGNHLSEIIAYFWSWEGINNWHEEDWHKDVIIYMRQLLNVNPGWGDPRELCCPTISMRSTGLQLVFINGGQLYMV